MRLLAIAADPSLEVALTMMDDWEVLSVPDVRTAASRATGVDAMVIGIGATDHGLAHAAAARAEGVSLAIVVVGDVFAEAERGIEVVVRPFSMDDVKAAIERAIVSARARPTVVLDEPARDDEPDAEQAPAAEQARAAEQGPVEHAPAAGRPLPPKEPSEPLPPIGAIPDDAAFEGIDLGEIEVPALPEIDEPPVERVEEPVPTRSAAPAPAAVTPIDVPSTQEPEPQPEPRSDPVLAAVLDPEPAPSPAPVEHRPITVASTSAPPIGTPGPQVERPRRRFGRRGEPVTQTQESPLERMLRAAAHGAHAIEALLEEFPIVTDEQSMTDALLREVVEMLSPSTAAVYVRDRDMFVIAASFGLSRAERTMKAKPDHPLFAELTINQEALLIAPVDLAQGLVAGIAGTHTNALLAAPICTEGEVIAFLVLGRTDYSEADLDVCDRIAREAGPGLAVARLLSMLAARRARDAS